jgi:hypothetical protein
MDLGIKEKMLVDTIYELDKQDVPGIAKIILCYIPYTDHFPIKNYIKNLKNEINDYEYEYGNEIHIPSFHQVYCWNYKNRLF